MIGFSMGVIATLAVAVFFPETFMKILEFAREQFIKFFNFIQGFFTKKS